MVKGFRLGEGNQGCGELTPYIGEMCGICLGSLGLRWKWWSGLDYPVSYSGVEIAGFEMSSGKLVGQSGTLNDEKKTEGGKIRSDTTYPGYIRNYT